jgi:UDP-N-acetylmuramoylalanine--D-glutamate ligase
MGVFFYNDSKSTIPASTLAALGALEPKPTILFLGGLSKGTDRSHLIKELPSNIVHVICFGKEAEQLHAWCGQRKISSFQCTTLDEAFTTALAHLKPDMQVVFSPAGSSFDLFKNYEERGTLFKQLVYALESKHYDYTKKTVEN